MELMELVGFQWLFHIRFRKAFITFRLYLPVSYSLADSISKVTVSSGIR